MSANLTSPAATTETDQSWSKEAILAIVSLLITLLLSGMGIVYKSRMKPSDFWTHTWGRILTNDEELAIARTKSIMTDWVDIADVWRYQQDTYTSALRMRRRPRLSNTSSRMNDIRW